MRVLFYKRVCHTHTCVNTVRTLPLNKLVALPLPPVADTEKAANLSELVAEASSGLGLRECFCIFVPLLAVGVITYSFVFEH